jgi:recombinational DNA repair protein RecT
MGNLKLSIEELNKMPLTEIARNETVKEKFMMIYASIWDEDKAESAYEKEKNYFNRIITANEELKRCTKLSIFTAFLDIAVNGLTLDQGSKSQCYLLPSGTCIGKDASGKKMYEKRCVLTVSGYGELAMRSRIGQIKYADNPIVIYEGDKFSVKCSNGKSQVDYEMNYPRTKDAKVVGAFIRIVRPDGSIDYSWMMQNDIDRLADYSQKNTKFDHANPLYSSNNGQIDTGFLCAKVIKHAFSSYPKVRVGKNTVFEADDPKPIDYGLEEEHQQPEPFGGPSNEISKGVKVEVNEDEEGAF